ncbi:MAG: aminopeptidase [Burkholderiaceae bacterium]
MPQRRHLWRAAALLCGALLLSGCSGTMGAAGYYWQSVQGHLQIMEAARPLEDWIARPDISPALRARLQLAQRARHFASQELGLPDNPSYRRYADLQRSAAVWNVVAAPPLALTLHTWCFPVTGCIGYRGYFSEADAQAEAARLQREGLEVEVYGVPAYSTLGYMNWLGGDPLLSTFIGWPEGDFVRLLFHELAHQVVYARGDTSFNESFATAVERLGVQRWLDTQASPETRAAHAASEARREAWRQLTRRTRAALAEVYDDHAQARLDETTARERKHSVMARFRADYAAVRTQWLNTPGTAVTPALLGAYDRWVASANNASFAAQGAYNDWVPAFVALHAQHRGNWAAFYDAVRQLARQPQAQRHEALRALMPDKETPGA